MPMLGAIEDLVGFLHDVECLALQRENWVPFAMLVTCILIG